MQKAYFHRVLSQGPGFNTRLADTTRDTLIPNMLLAPTTCGPQDPFNIWYKLLLDCQLVFRLFAPQIWTLDKLIDCVEIFAHHHFNSWSARRRLQVGSMDESHAVLTPLLFHVLGRHKHSWESWFWGLRFKVSNGECWTKLFLCFCGQDETRPRRLKSLINPNKFSFTFFGFLSTVKQLWWSRCHQRMNLNAVTTLSALSQKGGACSIPAAL